MTKYKLNNFKNGKSFIHQEESANGKIIIGNRICINTIGEKEMETLSTFVEKSKNVVPFSSKAM